MRPAAFFGTLAVAAALGAQTLSELVVVPGIEAQTHLMDANLAMALAGPIHLRLAEVVLAAALVLAAVVPGWLGSRVASTMTLLAVAAAAANRMLLLPAAYAAWSRADRVAGRPVDRILEAEGLAEQSHWLSATIAALLIAIVWTATRVAGTRASRVDRPSPAEAPAPEHPSAAVAA